MMETRIPALKPAPVEKRRSSKLAFVLAALFLVVMAVLFFQSSLSKVTEIEVRGTRHTDPEEVRRVAGVEVGDWFFVPSAAELERRVGALPAVEKVTVSRHFPGLLIIEVQEYPEVALERSAGGELSVVLANGLNVDPRDAVLPDKPVLTGWDADDPNRKALLRVLGDMPPELLGDVSEIVPDPSKAYPDRIKLYTRSRFEVITTVSKMKEKIPYLDEIVENREPGVITMLEVDTYTPFSVRQRSADPNTGPSAGEKTAEHKDLDSTQ